MDFFSAHAQRPFDDVLWLPQEGAVAGPTGRPPNSYAYASDAGLVLVDAVYSWTLPAVRALVGEDRAPLALVVTHADVMGQADALAETVALGFPVLLHPADQRDERSKKAARGAGLTFEDPMGHPALAAAGLRAHHVPGHSPGSVVLTTPAHGGIAFAGDSAVGPGPRQDVEPARLLRPPDGGQIAAFWRMTLDAVPLRSILPLHGTPYVDRDDLREIARTLWDGGPMDPSDDSASAA